MPGTYEAVCDCCLETIELWTPELENRDCPICGVGKLLGPYRAPGSRFSRSSDWDFVAFRLDDKPAERPQD